MFPQLYCATCLRILSGKPQQREQRIIDGKESRPTVSVSVDSDDRDPAMRVHKPAQKNGHFGGLAADFLCSLPHC